MSWFGYPVDVIVASALTASGGAASDTQIPIVMSTLPDPAERGSSRAGTACGNTTGLTLDSEDLAGKQLELLKDALRCYPASVS